MKSLWKPGAPRSLPLDRPLDRLGRVGLLGWLSLGAVLGLAGCDDGGGGSAVTDAAADAALDRGPEVDAELPACANDRECPTGRYCLRTEGVFDGRCLEGCRLDEPESCPARTFCEAETRTCVSDGLCVADDECPSETWCDDGACVPGCRVVEPDRCPAGPDGAPAQCDPATRACVPLVPCCDGGCSLALPGTCTDRPGAGFTRCVNPNPCEARCTDDDDCGEGEYCAANRLCAEGCNPANPLHCISQICDPERRQCVGRTCEDDAACFADEYCDLGANACRVGCRTAPDNCRAGLFCTATRQCGAGCLGDAGCVARNGLGWRCEDGACVAPCGGDTDCGAEEICEPVRGAEPAPGDPLRGECVGGCRDDALEGVGGNDDQLRARPLDFGADPNGVVLADLRACPRNADWYRFETRVPGTRVRVTVRFAHADGDLDAQLYVPGVGGAEGPVIRAQTATDDEVMVAEGPAGTWYVHVYARGFARNDYTLEVALEVPVVAECVPDAAEGPGAGPGVAGRDDSPAGATVVALPGLQARQTFDNRSICAGDQDWYRFDLGDNDGLEARLSLLGNGTGEGEELDLAIFGPGAPGFGDVPVFVVNGAGGGVNGPRYVEFSAPRGNPQVLAGTYYLRVDGLDAEQAGAYRLEVAVDRVRLICAVDPEEPNDTLLQAFDLGTLPDITLPSPAGPVLVPDVDVRIEPRGLCGGDADWYRLRTQAGDDLTVTLQRNEVPVVGDTIVEIRNAGAVVGSPGRNAQARNVARAVDLPAGVHYIQVVGATDRVESDYTLIINRAPAVLPCVPDALEGAGGGPDNDVPARASAGLNLAGPGPDGAYAGSLNGGQLCGREGDVDWFVLDSPAFGDLEVTLRFSHARANLELDVFREGAAEAENANSVDGHSATDDEVVRLQDRAAGRYLVRVRAIGDGVADYRLEARLVPRIFACVDDPDEPNDTFETAVDLGSAVQERVGQWICERVPPDIDVFRVVVPANRTRSVAASFVFGDDGDLALEIYDADRALRANTVDLPRALSKQCVVLQATGVQRVYHLRVRPLAINRVIDDDERLDYVLRVLDGDACELVAPPTPGIVWPRVVD